MLSAGDAGDAGSIPGSGRSPGGGQNNPFQYSCLENPHGQRRLAGHFMFTSLHWGGQAAVLCKRLVLSQCPAETSLEPLRTGWMLVVTSLGPHCPRPPGHLDPGHAHLVYGKAEAFSKEFPTKADTWAELLTLSCPS